MSKLMKLRLKPPTVFPLRVRSYIINVVNNKVSHTQLTMLFLGIMLLMLFLTSCGGVKTVYKGTHFSLPPQFSTTTAGYHGVAYFDSSCIYHIPDADMFDWNKLGGVKSVYFKPREEAAMVAWRWDTLSSKLQFIPYVNQGEVRYFYDEYMVEKAIGDSLNYSILYDKKQWYIIVDDKVAIHPLLIPNRKKYRIVHWFGGNKAAPHNISIRYLWNKVSF